MQNKTFKLSIVAAALMAAHSANAALYKIVPVDSGVDANQVYSSAISDSKTASEQDPLGCFSDSVSCTETDYELGGDTREGEDGISYRDEVPFKYDNHFTYLDLRDLRNYCYNELGYSTCESWAIKQWFGGNSENDEESCDYSLTGGLCQERRAVEYKRYTANAKGFTESGSFIEPPVDTTDAPSSEPEDNSINTVINKFSSDGSIIGIASSGYYDTGSSFVLTYRQRGFYGDTVLLPKQDGEPIVKQMGRTFAYDSFEYNSATYVVGSASIAPFDNDDDNKNYWGDLSKCTDTTATPNPVIFADCQNFAFATQAYVWDSTSGTSGKAISGWDNTTKPNEDDAAAQGSARAAALGSAETNYSGLPVLGGFNTHEDEDNYLMQAAIFYPKTDTIDPAAENQWDSVFVQGAEIEDDGDYIYSNSLIKDINQNLIAIGEAKRSGRYPENGASNNRLFYTDASKGNSSTKPVATYLSGDIFFKGAGGEANAINNYNEVVGSIDAEDNREVDGKERRRRGFIDPLNFPDNGTNADRLALFKGQAWWLDNLTNGGPESDNNNQYRIVNATGINDDGVISATANYCAGGYDDTYHNSYCGDGAGTEELVAVKLMPIAKATADDIVLRKGGKAPVDREGASLGYFALTLLGLLGFRRKKIKM